MRALLEQLLERRDLTEAQAYEVMVALGSADIEPALSGALLAALRSKGETADEVRGFAKAMRELAIAPQLDASEGIDIVGTGGDGSSSLNLSTGAALLTAATGLPVVKHGNRSVSSKSGSADVLEQLGLNLPLAPAQAGACLQATGFTFMFAPHYHPAMKSVVPVRKAMAVRTVFNILGPLTNPAAPPYYLLGAFSLDTARLMADALSGLPIKRGFVVHGTPGWDEATPCGTFELFDVREGQVQHTTRDPKAIGIARCQPQDLAGGDAAYNAKHLRAVLENREHGAHRDALALGCALALEISGRAASWQEGLAMANEAIDSGAAARTLQAIGDFAQVRA